MCSALHTFFVCCGRQKWLLSPHGSMSKDCSCSKPVVSFKDQEKRVVGPFSVRNAFVGRRTSLRSASPSLASPSQRVDSEAVMRNNCRNLRCFWMCCLQIHCFGCEHACLASKCPTFRLHRLRHAKSAVFIGPLRCVSFVRVSVCPSFHDIVSAACV